MNIEVFSKIIWILFSLLIAEGKHGGYSSFSSDAQHRYYTEHQRNNEQCFPHFPLAVFGWAIVSLVSEKGAAILLLPLFLKENGKQEKKRSTKGQNRGKQIFAADSLLMHRLVTGHELWGISVGTNYVQKFSKNCQCRTAVGSIFQTQIILSYLLLQTYMGWSCNSAALHSAGAGNKAAPEATEVLHMEGNLLLPSRRAEVSVPPSRVECTVTERENQQQKGMGLLWPWKALC